MMNKEMKLGIANNALIVKFVGDVDNLVCEPYKNKLETIINENKYKKVIMDFSKVTFIDSSGLGLILGRYNQLRRTNSNLYVCGVNKQTEKIFNIAGIWTIMDRYENLEQALKTVGVSK
jgi:stage II sporulation protein AA (anti-sigma F factor antagonist)